MVELRIPGPTPCPPEVLQVMARQMVNHRGSDFIKTMNGVTDKLKQVFMTKNDVFVLTGSGTGGMEAAIVNTYLLVIRCWRSLSVPSATVLLALPGHLVLM